MRVGIAIASVLLFVCACDGGTTAPASSDASSTPASSDGTPAGTEGGATLADVTAVEVSGGAGAYTFAVTIRSPDTGCDRYADWWEVTTESGELVHRRILAHSHVDEQPFTRSSSPVEVDAATTVIVRAHLSRGGYGGVAMRGSAADGFAAADLPADFAAQLETADPLPTGCAF